VKKVEGTFVNEREVAASEMKQLHALVGQLFAE